MTVPRTEQVVPVAAPATQLAIETVGRSRSDRSDVRGATVDDGAASAELTRDAAWVARIRGGDEIAFAAMFDAFCRPLLAFACAQLRSRGAAEEVVQDLFTSIWMRRSAWVVRRSLRTYLFQAVRNRVLNYQRDMRARMSHWAPPDLAADMLAAQPAPQRADDRVGVDELRHAVAHAVSALPARNREVFLLVRRHHLSYAEAADVLGVSPKAVEQHMMRAFHALRVRLAQWRD